MDLDELHELGFINLDDLSEDDISLLMELGWFDDLKNWTKKTVSKVGKSIKHAAHKVKGVFSKKKEEPATPKLILII